MRKNLNLVLEKLSEIMNHQSPEKLDDWWQGWEWNMKEYLIVHAIEELYDTVEQLGKKLDKLRKKIPDFSKITGV